MHGFSNHMHICVLFRCHYKGFDLDSIHPNSDSLAIWWKLESNVSIIARCFLSISYFYIYLWHVALIANLYDLAELVDNDSTFLW